MTSDRKARPPVVLSEQISARGIAYSSRGTGPPAILLHGWCLSRGLWMYQEASLLEAHRVICPDLAGFGGSRGLAGPYGLERQADEVEMLLEELGVARAAVVGFAFGAAVAMELAARPGVVERAVLIGVPSAAHAAYRKMPRAMRRDWPEFARRSAVAICHREQSQAALGWLATMFAGTPLPVALETVEVLAEFEPLPLAGRLRAPALFVHGELDGVVPVSVSEECAAAAPEARLEVVPGAGHLVPIDAPAELDAILRRELAAR